MCWYSQYERLSTRKAIEGEELRVCNFHGQGQWLVSPENPSIPVCLPNGCKLRITNIPPKLQKELKLGPEEVAEFREVYQKSPDSLLGRIFLPPKLCFDVVLFDNGRALEVSVFAPEIKVDVLSQAIASPFGSFSNEEKTDATIQV